MKRYISRKYVLKEAGVLFITIILIFTSIFVVTPITKEAKADPPYYNPVNAELEYSWSSSSKFPNSIKVMMTPIVADINQDGAPDIIYNTFEGYTYSSNGVLRAASIQGGNLVEFLTFPDPSWSNHIYYHIFPTSTPAIGDLDGDGYPEIVALNIYGIHCKLMSVDYQGNLEWITQSFYSNPPYRRILTDDSPAPAIADLDNDGTPEIVLGDLIFDNVGNLIAKGDQGDGLYMSCIADVDLDGIPEIIAGNKIYSYADSSLSLEYNLCQTNGYTAVGNFDDDDYAEIVLVCPGRPPKVYLINHNGGEPIFSITLTGEIGGSPPTIDDCDGDGFPEICVATTTKFYTFDIQEEDGILWSNTIQDPTTGRVGSTVFDLDGNGIKEVIYNDWYNLFIWDGTDGLLQDIEPNDSWTQRENPVIVDIDNDDSAEIIVVSSKAAVTEGGIRVFDSGDETEWVNARSIWNQQTYHITNVDDDGSIPNIENINWLYPEINPYNNFRIQNANLPPVADAGLDQTLEQTSYAGADVNLDGSGSYDPDGDPLTYDWTWDGGSATGVNPTVTFPLGTTTVTLVVNDGTVDSDPDTVVVTVEDTTPPEITHICPIDLWPPNHKYHTIEISDFVTSVTDIGDPDVDIDDVIITSVSSDEPEDVVGNGDGNTFDDIVIVDAQTLKLRSERQGAGNGRVYTINFEVTDLSGNTAIESCEVWVRHDQSGDPAIDDGPDAGYTMYYP